MFVDFFRNNLLKIWAWIALIATPVMAIACFTLQAVEYDIFNYLKSQERKKEFKDNLGG